MANLSNDFKAAFGKLLLIEKIDYKITNALNYSQTLYEWTLGGLITEGKLTRKWANGKLTYIGDYAQDFTEAEKLYIEAITLIKITSREEWKQQQILEKCFVINKIIFPIALSEGILELKENMADIMMGYSRTDAPQIVEYGGKK